MAEGQTRDALFGDTDFFRKGLNDLIGLPDTQILAAMEAEHQSQVEFKTSNYNITTSPWKEWHFVVDAEDPRQGELNAGTGGTHGREHKALEVRRRVNFSMKKQREGY